VFNEPGGLLFGEPPLKPGQKRQWEDWELPWYTFLGGGLFIFVFGVAQKPGSQLDQWAKEEVVIRHNKLAEEQKALDAAAKAAALAVAEDS